MITVTHYRDDDVSYTNRHVWPLRSVAESDDETVPPEIFVYQNVKDEYTGESLGSFFLDIATPDQMVHLSTNASEAMYRASEITLNTRSDDEREIIASDIDEKIVYFNEDMFFFKVFGIEETVNIGA